MLFITYDGGATTHFGRPWTGDSSISVEVYQQLITNSYHMENSASVLAAGKIFFMTVTLSAFYYIIVFDKFLQSPPHIILRFLTHFSNVFPTE